MVERKENGKLAFKSLDFEIFIGDIYEQCNTESEINFIMENMQGIVESLAEERLEEL